MEQSRNPSTYCFLRVTPPAGIFRNRPIGALEIWDIWPAPADAVTCLLWWPVFTVKTRQVILHNQQEELASLGGNSRQFSPLVQNHFNFTGIVWKPEK